MLLLRVVATALALAGAWLLVVAGVQHARHRTWLRAVLAAQGLVPVGLRPAVLAVLGPVEMLLGAGSLTVLGLPLAAAGTSGVLRVLVLVGLGAAYTVFAVAMGLLLRRSPGTPCGCFGDDEPASRFGVLRNTLVAVATVACLLTGRVAPSWSLVALAASVVLAAALWLGPRFARD